MPDLRVTMARRPNLDDAEVSRRLAMAYDLIIQCTREKRTADGCEAGRPDPSAAGDTPAQEAGSASVIVA